MFFNFTWKILILSYPLLLFKREALLSYLSYSKLFSFQ